MKCFEFLCLLSVLCLCEAYKILAIFPVPVRSLNILGEAFVRHLHTAGHEITYVTAFPLKNPPHNNFRQIDLSDHEAYLEGDTIMNITFLMENNDHINVGLFLQQIGVLFAEPTFANKDIIKLLSDPKEHFDVVLAEMMETEIYNSIAALYKCPMIWSFSMGVNWHITRTMDGFTNPAYTINYRSTRIQPFTFAERVAELWNQLSWMFFKRFNIGFEENRIYEQYLTAHFKARGVPMPPYDEIIYNASLMFVHESPAVGRIPSIPQSIKLVGGYHIEVPPKPLPKDLQGIMDNATNGVIYFSLGSTWKSIDIPKQITDQLLKIFGELKQTIIWKFEADLPNLPKNVHISPWVPQTSILAHSNCKIFITHGGLLSATESIHFGVPTIAIPVFFDQFLNANKAVANGYALKVDLNYDLAQNLKTAIVEMLNNSKYKTRMEELTYIYHDRLVPPSQEIVHWVEHIIKTKGAPHLRSPAIDLPAYQRYYLDLLALLLLFAIATAVGVKIAVYRLKVALKTTKTD